tara:strand:- start:263 stop:682 length:420 start_codon:yes stop_codon:yes gene_type:complete
MKKIILLIFSISLFISCSDSNRKTLILGLWCSYDADAVNPRPICFDFEPGGFPDGYDRLIIDIMLSKDYIYTIDDGQFKIEGDKIYIRIPNNSRISEYSTYFEQNNELTIKNINENSVFLIDSSGKGITLVREKNPRAL